MDFGLYAAICLSLSLGADLPLFRARAFFCACLRDISGYLSKLLYVQDMNCPSMLSNMYDEVHISNTWYAYQEDNLSCSRHSQSPQLNISQLTFITNC